MNSCFLKAGPPASGSRLNSLWQGSSVINDCAACTVRSSARNSAHEKTARAPTPSGGVWIRQYLQPRPAL